ncbi:MAG: hypothetical protein ACLFQM_09755 [Fidelibacterota bacterium]
MNKGGFLWKRATGITKMKTNISRSLGVPLTKSGRQQKIGKAVKGGCLIQFLLIISFVFFVS